MKISHCQQQENKQNKGNLGVLVVARFACVHTTVLFFVFFKKLFREDWTFDSMHEDSIENKILEVQNKCHVIEKQTLY